MMWTLGDVRKLPLMEPVDVGPDGMWAWYWSVDGAFPNGQKVPALGEWEWYRPGIRFVGEGFRTRFAAMDMMSGIPDDATHIHRVRVAGTVVPTYKVLSATKIKVEWSVPAEPVLSAFARWCALIVARVWTGRWSVPKAVVEFLKTGDESLRPQASKEVSNTELGVPADVEVVQECRMAARYAISSRGGDGAVYASWYASRNASSRDRALDVMGEKLEQILNEYHDGRRKWVWLPVAEREWYNLRYERYQGQYRGGL